MAMPAKNILLHEDELLIAEALEHILREEGYANDVAIALAEAKERLHAALYDAVIADCRLPEL
jgi:DNA-binding response OmpR family regulator